MFQTTPHRPRRRARRLAAGTLTIAALSLAACGGDDDSTTSVLEDVVIDSHGADDGRVQLPGRGEVGHAASGTTSISTELAVDGAGVDNSVSVSLALTQDSEIVEVTDDGGYVTESEFTGAESDTPAGAEVDLEELVGVVVRQATDPGGNLGELELVDADSLTSAQRAAFDAMASDLATNAIVYPDEPVGVGASWRATITVQRQGIEIPITYDYQLTAIDGDSYTIDITYDQDIDTEVRSDGQRADVTGNVSGSGTFQGSVTNPLVLVSTVDQDMDMRIAAGGESIEMDMDIELVTDLTEHTSR